MIFRTVCMEHGGSDTVIDSLGVLMTFWVGANPCPWQDGKCSGGKGKIL